MVAVISETRMQRNRLIDALRGLCFVVMTVNHLPGAPLERFSNSSYGLLGFFTAASGFVFISGLIAGTIYERDWQFVGAQPVMRRMWRQLRMLYLYHISLYGILWVLVGMHVRGSAAWRLDLFHTHPLKALWMGGILLYEPGYLGILPMYCIFIALTPLVLHAMRRGHLWGVLSGSIMLWATAGLMIRLPVEPKGLCFGAFNPLCYQLLFSFGLAFGAGHISLQRFSPCITKWMVRLAIGLTAAFFVLRMVYAASPTLAAWVQARHHGFGVINLGPLRVLNFAAFSVLLFWVAQRRKWGRCATPVGRFFVFLGQHSLPVFTWSILTTYLAQAVLPDHLPITLRVGAMLLVVPSLLCPAFVHAKLKPYIATQSKPKKNQRAHVSADSLART
jgi:hypothetical protein